MASIAEEHFARLIAQWHGQKMVVRRGGQTLTVAGMAGYDSGWAWETDKYVDNHWQDYIAAAQAMGIIYLTPGATRC